MNSEKIRTFVAIDIPKNIRKMIKNVQKKIPEFQGKKTELENLHLTLKFLGHITGEQLEEVKKRLKKIKFKEFETKIAKIGVFDNSRSKKYTRQTIVWLHMENAHELQKKIDKALSGLFEKERRFMSHITIARVKRFGNKEKFFGKIKNIKFPEMKFMIKDFKLKKSNLSNKGPVYQDLEVYGLEQ